MKLNEFEAHPLWTQVGEIKEWLTQIRAQDSGANIDLVDELDTRVAQLAGAFRARRRLAALVIPSQLDAMHSIYQGFWNAVNTAFEAGTSSTRPQYLQQAVSYAHQGTIAQGAWAAAAPTQVEERLEVAVVDALLQRDKEAEETTRLRIEAVERELASTDERAVLVTAAVTKADTDLSVLVAEAQRAVDAEKARIVKVIDDGNAKIAGFEAVLDNALKEWEKERTKAFEGRLKNVRDKQDDLLKAAQARYEALKATVEDYQALVQADSADRLAKHYEDEAGAASSSGWKTTIAGFAVLLVAGLPLFLVVIQPILNSLLGWSIADPDWPAIAARAGVAAVLVGAATVAIRIGNGFLKRSADYKRLAMELRTMGPFLSAVNDRESVDQARLDLVGRAFAQAYVPQKEDAKDDAISVTVLQQLLTLLTKTVSR